MYRCSSTGHDEPVMFAVELGKSVKCPKCVADKAIPRYASLIAEIVMIHFDAPGDLPGYGSGVMACEPTMTIPNKRGDRATGEPSAVTCPMCKQTDAWKECMAEMGLPVVPKTADFDYMAERDRIAREKAASKSVPVPAE